MKIVIFLVCAEHFFSVFKSVNRGIFACIWGSRLEKRLCNYTDICPPAHWFSSDPSKRVAWEFGYRPVTTEKENDFMHSDFLKQEKEEKNYYAF